MSSSAPAAFPSSPASSSSSSASASVPMVVITVVGIVAAFALLASYYAFVTKCQLLRAVLSRNPPWREPTRAAAPCEEQRRRGLGMPLIRMLPVVTFTAAAEGRRASTSSECAVCLSEFAERERVRLLPGCAHAFHIDCIDTWLQGSARCPFCRRSVTLPPLPLLPPRHDRHWQDELCASGNEDTGSIVIEVRGEHESWAAAGGGRKVRKKAVGDEAVETTRRKEFAVEPMRRSLSMDSSCDKLHVSVVKEFLAQRQMS
ncbi:RING-H2 finger protein ATL16 [Lolium perenne]|uniref:RING-H2 finger protein ATL16 n=1 Tax=Lolium perenne TaxID=4522 RepID=UPI0021F68AB2|nr:RING-H2 finger protein ATL1-like [Lolium perenne]